MASKILKFELFFLFFLTIFSFYSFYYYESLPDNFFRVTSASEGLSTLGYYWASFVAFIGYYSGPWVILPFFVFMLFYSFLFSKREYALDPLSTLFLIGSSLCGFYIFFPAFLGDGLRYYIKMTANHSAMLLALPLFIVTFISLTFRSSFKESVVLTARGIPKVMRWIWRFPQKFKRKTAVRPISKRSILSYLKIKIPSFLKGDDKRELHGATQITVDFQTPNDEVEMEESEVDEEEDPFPPVMDKKSLLTTPRRFLNKRKKGKTKSKKTGGNASSEAPDYGDLITMMVKKGSSKSNVDPDDAYFEQIIQQIEDKLGEFRIDARIINILKGPVVDTFELELGSGIKVSRITSITEDLSLALHGAPIRIVYPMRGRTTLGIEVPRSPRDVIYLEEVLGSRDFISSTYRLPVCMGKDAFGEAFTVDLASMPHMLVAGSTGSGKSVFINTLLVSLLIKKSPREMKLILIDPKQLELALYTEIPHLAFPVVTNAKTASLAFLWAVQEMERRYSIMKAMGVRNLEGYNEKLKKASNDDLAKIQLYFDDYDEGDYFLPYIVIVVDEFADLILTKAGKEIENNICRIAAKARAAGIHLVLATQRPSVDVITGLIKSNFPTRVSFRVTTSIDSRTILNAVGAEKLLGKGDMLYKHGIEMRRLHSAYVDENEIEALVEKLEAFPGGYSESAVEFLESGGKVEEDPYAFGSHISTVRERSDGDDEFFDEALKIVMEHRSASASMLQRRLKIGYNRAANIIEEMEKKGIVGPGQGSKPRKVLLNETL